MDEPDGALPNVLSFHRQARLDDRCVAALTALRQKLNEDGRLSVERPRRSLATLDLSRRYEPSEAATNRYREVVDNVRQEHSPCP